MTTPDQEQDAAPTIEPAAGQPDWTSDPSATGPGQAGQAGDLEGATINQDAARTDVDQDRQDNLDQDSGVE